MADYAVHPNLLVYWTGSDIDNEYHPEWRKRNSSETDPRRVAQQEREYGKTKNEPRLEDLEQRYIDRLASILEHGLWVMRPTKPEIEELVRVFGQQVGLPDVARVCFTELRLSNARSHARQYGRLGIGVKPPFVFDRGGRPVLYYGTKAQRKRDVFLQWLSTALKDTTNLYLAHFLKPMRGRHKGEPYEFYEESEWRVVCTTTLAKHDNAARGDRQRKGVCHAGCVRAAKPTQEYLDGLNADERKEADKRLRYLLPLDGWLSCIIYPSVSLKEKALRDQRIRQEICRIKTARECRANEVETGNWPVEIDLDLCRNL